MDTWREKLNSELKTAEYLNDSVEVRLASADDDNASQLSQINYFIDQGVSLLIVSPNQVNAISPALERAHNNKRYKKPIREETFIVILNNFHIRL